MKICITGGAGYIGHYCLLRLSQISQISHVVCLSRKKRPTHFPVSADLVQWVEGDVMEIRSLEKAFTGCDVVLHLAGLMPDQTTSEAELFSCNYDGTKNVIQACKEASVPRVIFASTYAVYGDLKDRVEISLSEQSPVDPKSAYAYSKLRAEEEVARSGLSHYLLRFSHVYGVGAGIGDPGGVLLNFIRSARENKKIILKGDYLISRDYIHLRDVVEILILILLNPSPSARTLNVASGIPVTLRDVARGIQSIMQEFYDWEIALEIESPASEIGHVITIENRRLFELFEDLNLTPLADGMKELIKIDRLS